MSQRVLDEAGLKPLCSASRPTVMLPPSLGGVVAASVWLVRAPVVTGVPPLLLLLLPHAAAAMAMTHTTATMPATSRFRGCTFSKVSSPCLIGCGPVTGATRAEPRLALPRCQ